MTWRRDQKGSFARARSGLHMVADIVAFVVESACVGNGVFWFLTWGMLSFNWEFTAREYGRFWTHYAKASAAARHPVEVAALVIFVGITAFVAFVRAPKARQARGSWRDAWRALRRVHADPANEYRP